MTVGVNLAVLYPLCKLIFSSGPWGLAFTAVGFAAATAGIKYFLGLTQVLKNSVCKDYLQNAFFPGGSWHKLWKEVV